MIKRFCDMCSAELTRNMVDERLVVESGHFEAEVIVGKDGVANDGDLCLDCLLSMLTQKPKRKYVRKQVSTYTKVFVSKDTVDKAFHGMVGTIMSKNQEESPVASEVEPQLKVTIRTPEPPEYDGDYVVTIGDSEGRGKRLKEAILKVLESFGDNIPDVSDSDRKLLEAGLGGD